MSAPLLAISLSPTQIVIVLAIGILLFGRRLPEIGRMLGKGLTEFRKGMAGMEDEFLGTGKREEPAAATAAPTPRPPQRLTESTPKFTEADGATNGTAPLV